MPELGGTPCGVTVTVGDDAMPIDCEEAHEAANGGLCEEDKDGDCRICGESVD